LSFTIAQDFYNQNVVIMKSAFLVPVGGVWFSFFYNLAFFLFLLIVIAEGYKRNYPMAKWIFLLILSRIFFMIGTRIINWSWNDWLMFYQTFTLPAATGKSMLGGLLLGLPALLAGRYIMRIRSNVCDAFAIAFPLGVGIQRLGCFLTGCCYGSQAAVPWAVQYPAYTLPHFHQYEAGLISDHLSLAVHPVQIYEMMGMLMASMIVLFYRKRFKVQGSLLIFSLMLIMLVRFVTEFFRDPLAHASGGALTGPFNTIQWIILPAAAIMALWLWRRESGTYEAGKSPAHSSPDFGLMTGWLLLCLFALLIHAMRKWFDWTEMLALVITLAVAAFFLGMASIRQLYTSPLRWVYLMALLLPLLFMSQSIPGETADTLAVKIYHTLSVGFSSGSLKNEQTYSSGSGCDQVSSTHYFEHDFRLLGGGIATSRSNANTGSFTQYGLNVYFGNHSEKNISLNKTETTPLWALNPYIVHELNWLGFGTGLHLGNISYLKTRTSQQTTQSPISGRNKYPIYPQFYARVGPRSILFAEYRFAYQFLSPFPGNHVMYGVGTGFGYDNGLQLRAGYGIGKFYMAGYFPLSNQIVMEPFLSVGDGNKMFSLGFGYRFRFKSGKPWNF
jgi:prolipoprotein diacylglyceryltransferase